jgi:hypothetical protein
MDIRSLLTSLKSKIDSLALTYRDDPSSITIVAEGEGISSTFQIRIDRVPGLTDQEIDLIADQLVTSWALRRFRRYY